MIWTNFTYFDSQQQSKNDQSIRIVLVNWNKNTSNILTISQQGDIHILQSLNHQDYTE